MLLLAATPGTATIGLLYIASYLRRNGINTYCKYNNLNVNEDELKKILKSYYININLKLLELV